MCARACVRACAARYHVSLLLAFWRPQVDRSTVDRPVERLATVDGQLDHEVSQLGALLHFAKLRRKNAAMGRGVNVN